MPHEWCTTPFVPVLTPHFLRPLNNKKTPGQQHAKPEACCSLKAPIIFNFGGICGKGNFTGILLPSPLVDPGVSMSGVSPGLLYGMASFEWIPPKAWPKSVHTTTRKTNQCLCGRKRNLRYVFARVESCNLIFCLVDCWLWILDCGFF